MVLFFLTSRENAAGPKGRVMRTWQSPYEIPNDWRRLRHGWSPVPAVEPFYSARTVSSPSPACQALDKKSWWEAKSLLANKVTTCECGACTQRVASTVDIDRRPIFWYEDTSTVDIDQFFLVWIHIDGRFRPIFGWNRRSIKYRPYFQVGESLLTIDIDRIR